MAGRKPLPPLIEQGTRTARPRGRATIDDNGTVPGFAAARQRAIQNMTNAEKKSPRTTWMPKPRRYGSGSFTQDA